MLFCWVFLELSVIKKNSFLKTFCLNDHTKNDFPVPLQKYFFINKLIHKLLPTGNVV